MDVIYEVSCSSVRLPSFSLFLSYLLDNIYLMLDCNVLHCTILHATVQYSTVQYSTLIYFTTLCCTRIAQYLAVLFWSVIHSALLAAYLPLLLLQVQVPLQPEDPHPLYCTAMEDLVRILVVCTVVASRGSYCHFLYLKLAPFFWFIYIFCFALHYYIST